ncbi:hypothetical protein Ocin01_12173 [Orchesella cincta]|uniref:Uncharacterized protein n=1 Tax=Orchesella cincta TaxID=48709 RepID=A0A1D2MN91_ORCCI|nr:hypothetical protein Ocin01_12173 [Orchesella cincta]
MNKLSFVLLGLLFVSAYAVPAADNVSESEKKVFQETVTVEEGIVTNAVTPLKSIFLPNMARVACWVCSYPCGAYYCCNDGYPQCCVVSGRCRCCRG